MELAQEEPTWSVRPVPAFCVKTRDLRDKNGVKIFLNFCTCDELPCPDLIDEQRLTAILESRDPGSYKIPLSLGDAHPEVDKSGRPCRAYDVIVNRVLYEERLKSSDLFRTFLIIVAVDALYDKYGVNLDKDNFVMLKNRKNVGQLANQHIRQKPKSPMIVELNDEPSDAVPVETDVKQPKFTLVKDAAKNATKISGEFRLIGVKSSKDIDLRVGNDRVALSTNSGYFLDICLPCEIRVDHVTAEYSLKKEILFVILPLSVNKL